jgi:LacI family transcriptional regulator
MTNTSVTQKDIAAALNVSQGLVAQVLNDRAGVRATPETRKRILDKARELEYKPNSAARMLRSGRTKTVVLAFVRPREGHNRYVYAMVIETLAEALGGIGYQLQICAVGDQASLLASLRDSIAMRSCDMVVLNGDDDAVEEQGRLLEETEIPFAVFGRHERNHPTWLQADFDHEGMMEGCVAHLVNLGHKRIAFFGLDERSNYVNRLAEGFVEAMKRHTGSDPESLLLAHVGDISEPATVPLNRWLNLTSAERPTGLVIATGDNTWLTVEMGLAKRGIVVGEDPGQFAITGITDDEFPLLHGTAHAYSELELNYGLITTDLLENIIMDRLRDKDPKHNIVRTLPKMSKVLPRHVPEIREMFAEFLKRNKG